MNILFLVLALLGIVIGTLPIVVWWLGRLREKRRQMLKDIIKRGIDKFISYNKLYQKLYAYHKIDISQTNANYSAITLNYFKNTIGSSLTFAKFEDRYAFPLFFRHSWLLSRSKSLDFKLKTIDSHTKLPENSLNRPTQMFLKKFGISDYCDFLSKECEKNIWDQETFDLYAMYQKNGILEFTCCMGMYSNFAQTYELVQKELYYNFVCGKHDFALRKTINFAHLEDYHSRPAKIGLNVCLVMKRPDGGDTLFIHKRRETLVEYPGFYHVIPAGTFQPVTTVDRDKQFNFTYSIAREILEELFNMEEADKTFRKDDPMKIFSLPVTRQGLPTIVPGKILFGENPDLDKTFTNNFDLVPTGFLVDILSFKPELLFFMYVKNPEIYRILDDYIEKNWEGEGIFKCDITGYKYNRNAYKFIEPLITVDYFLPAGAVAICEGLKYYEENIKNR